MPLPRSAWVRPWGADRRLTVGVANLSDQPSEEVSQKESNDMLVALRRAILAAQYLPGSLLEPTPPEILEVQRAWAAAAA